MKKRKSKVTIIIILTILVLSKSQAFTQIVFQDTLSNNQGFEFLDLLKFIKTSNKQNHQSYFAWKPNKSYDSSLNISSDGYAYTTIDTILNKRLNDDSIKVICLRTNQFNQIENKERELVNCHFCNASFGVIIYVKSNLLNASNDWNRVYKNLYVMNLGRFGAGNRSNFALFKLRKVVKSLLIEIKEPVLGNNSFEKGFSYFYSIDVKENNEKIFKKQFCYVYYEAQGKTIIKRELTNVDIQKKLFRINEQEGGKIKKIELSFGSNLCEKD